MFTSKFALSIHKKQKQNKNKQVCIGMRKKRWFSLGSLYSLLGTLHIAEKIMLKQ